MWNSKQCDVHQLKYAKSDVCSWCIPEYMFHGIVTDVTMSTYYLYLHPGSLTNLKSNKSRDVSFTATSMMYTQRPCCSFTLLDNDLEFNFASVRISWGRYARSLEPNVYLPYRHRFPTNSCNLIFYKIQSQL